MKKKKDVLAPKKHGKAEAILQNIVSILLFLALWELLVRVFRVKEAFLCTPSSALYHLFWPQPDADYHWKINILMTLREYVLSFLIVAFGSIALSVLIVWSKRVQEILMPVFIFINSMPMVAVAPLLLIWIGYGLKTNILIAFLVSFFPMVINTIAGLNAQDRQLLDLVQYLEEQTLESLFNDLQNGVAKELKLLVKAEGHGSMEALNQSLNKLSTDEVAIKIIHSGVGAISESDIMLATASQATIIGFNVRPDSTVKRLAEQEKVDIRTYRVIYHVIEDIRKAMSGLLSPDIEEVEVGRVEVRQIFKISKAGKVAGCYVTEGKVTRNSLVRLVRDSKIIYEGSIDTLKRFKDDAHEVLEGYECGLTLTNYQDIQEGDIIDVYQKVEHEREI